MAPDRGPSLAVAAIAAIAFLALAVPGLVTAVYLWPPPPAPAPKVTIDLGALPAAGQAVPFQAPTGRSFAINGPASQITPDRPVASGWLARSGAGFFALAGYSTDTGCRLVFVESAAQFMDPCHGSQFGLDGAVLHGPAQRPLPRLHWRPLGGSRIAVITTT